MKITQPKVYGRGKWSAALQPSDFPKRALIEPKLAKLGFELTGDYKGTSDSPFLAEALAVSPEVIISALTLNSFEFEVPLRISSQKERVSFGVRFGFANLEVWTAFCRSISLVVPKLAESDRHAYAAYLFTLIKEDRSGGLQLAAMMGRISAMGKSPILSRGQVELFARLRSLGVRMDSDFGARFVASFTLVEALELLAADLTRIKLEQALAIRCELEYDASATELVEMLTMMPNSWIKNLLGDEVRS